MNDLRLSKKHIMLSSDVSLVLGFVSIGIAVFAWLNAKAGEPAHGERLGIFIGLWVPSFFILANRLARGATGSKG